ncbi:hypothetical protein MBLNU230_g5763t1 [Neophaeotheca triangularis]
MADGRPWSNDEKNYLLAEIIKAAPVPPRRLLEVINQLQIQPKWDEMPLPPGRSLNACRAAFQDIQRIDGPSPMQRSYQLGPQTPYSAPLPTAGKRMYGSDTSYPAARPLQPKPTSSLSSLLNQPPTEPPPKRKRGRPTKAEAQAKAEAAAATGEGQSGQNQPHQLQRSQSVVSVGPQSASGPGPGPTSTPLHVETRPSPQHQHQPTTRMPISAIMTPTTREPGTGSNSSSSSGKRRRGRSMRSDRGALGSAPASMAGGGVPYERTYESPYGGIIGNPEDTPAQTAAQRHRDEQQPHGTPYAPPPPPPYPEPPGQVTYHP